MEDSLEPLKMRHMHEAIGIGAVKGPPLSTAGAPWARPGGEFHGPGHLVLASFHRLLRLINPELLTHELNVGFMAGRLARELGFSPAAATEIEAAASLHDIGMLGVPQSILLKPDPLTADDWQVIRRHLDFGRDLLAGQYPRLLKIAADIAATHHAAFDGSGYPALSGNDIPMAARIAAVCDVYDALRDARPYRHALPHQRALEIMTAGDDRIGPEKFDPVVLDAFLKIAGEFRALRG